MNVLTVCSGIGAPEVAWAPLGWKFVAGSDIEAFPNAVRAHHFPDVPNWGDMTKFKDWPDANVALLVGGTPCQSFSVAGLRKGLADPRGNLALTFLAIAAKYSPRWIVWENVPGVLSSDEGRDFGAFLGGLGQCGYGWAYRVLDAQHFGVPQRRRRVFVVGHLGDWRRAAAVLFERHSLSGHPAPRRETREAVAALTANGVGTCGADDNQGQAGHLVASTGGVAHCLNAGGMGRQDYETETLIAHALRADGFDASEDGTGRGTPLIAISQAFNWQSGGDCRGLELQDTVSALTKEQTPAVTYSADISGALHGALSTACGDGNDERVIAYQGSAVRRLTPVECERLQGFPDNYTLVSYRGKPAADGPRYKALGNSMAVPVMRWIGERIATVEALTNDQPGVTTAGTARASEPYHPAGPRLLFDALHHSEVHDAG